MGVPSRIGVIVLAAGSSTRMGRPKQLLPYRGSTLLRHAVTTAVATGLTPIVVVLGAEAEKCSAETTGLPVQAIVNLDWEQGMGTSLRAGFNEIIRRVPELEAVLILLHDQPSISAARLRELVAAGRPGSCAVASLHGDALGVPALLGRELFPELASLQGKQGARRILDRHRARVVPFLLPEAGQDVDTPADYERIVEGASGQEITREND